MSGIQSEHSDRNLAGLFREGLSYCHGAWVTAGEQFVLDMTGPLYTGTHSGCYCIRKIKHDKISSRDVGGAHDARATRGAVSSCWLLGKGSQFSLEGQPASACFLLL